MNLEFRALNGPTDWAWCNEQVGIKQCEDTGGIVAYDLDKKELVAACIMDNWTQNSVQCHFMLTNPMVLRHRFLDCCFDFMFNHQRVSRIYGLVPGNNSKAIKFNKHLGFTVKATLEEAFEDGVDYLLMELKREDCSFINQIKEAA